MTPPPSRPLELPRLVMRRALWVALAAWLLVLALGLLRAAADIDQEVAAAQTMAAVSARLAQAAHWDDRRAIGELQQLQHAAPLRHLSLAIRDEHGAFLVAPAPTPSVAPPLAWLVALHRGLSRPAAPAAVSWPLPRDDGRIWQVTLATSGESERVEAIENLAGALIIGALGSVALLLVMAWNVRHAFRPMHGLIAAIASLRTGSADRLRALPSMPIGELHAIRTALHELAAALQAAEHGRQLLSQKVATLQEDERRRIARELHDEFGQRLTALRADLAWLQRQSLPDGRTAQVVAGMATACADLHRETRQLLHSLRPLGERDLAEPGDLAGLRRLLERLVGSWQRAADPPLRVELKLGSRDECTDAQQPGPWPGAEVSAAMVLPQAMVLMLYRISQEALTNVARHAQATHAVLQLTLCRPGEPQGGGAAIEWQVSDDGVGFDALESAQQRGNGLAGMRERIWAFGSDLQCAAARPAAVRPGVRLCARFPIPATVVASVHEAAATA